MSRIVEKIENIYSKYLDKKIAYHKAKVNKYNDKLDFLWKVIKHEKHFNVSAKTRISMYRKGFTADDYVKYNLEKNDKEDYISESERWKSRRINGEYNVILDDKQVFYYVFRNDIKTPIIIGTTKNGKLLDEEHHIIKIDEIKDYLKNHKGLIFRTNRNGGGRGLCLLEYRKEEYYVNDQQIEEKEIPKLIKACDNYIVTEAISNHPYSNKIFSKSVNTIRLIIGRNKDEDEYKILGAFHRFGCNESIPGDNVCRGGLIAPINIKTGVIGSATKSNTDKFFNKHPDTKADIAGVKIPHFHTMTNKMLSLSYKFPFLNFIAWDVVIMQDDFIVIEGNASSDINMLQYFGGLKDSAIGKLYKSYGIIKEVKK